MHLLCVCFSIGNFLKLTQILKVTVLHLGSGDSFLHYKVERKQSNISSMSGNVCKVKNSIVFQSLTNKMTNSTLSHKVLKCCIPGCQVFKLPSVFSFFPRFTGLKWITGIAQTSCMGCGSVRHTFSLSHAAPSRKNPRMYIPS